MKNLSLVISLALVALTLGACTKQTSVTKQSDSLQVQQNQLTSDQQDTGVVNGAGGEQNQGTEKNKMGGVDSTHTTHFHGSPNQNEVDSIKKAKTDKKFNK
jgi:uncharacterized alpha/beta hydrolase family protein